MIQKLFNLLDRMFNKALVGLMLFFNEYKSSIFVYLGLIALTLAVVLMTFVGMEMHLANSMYK